MEKESLIDCKLDELEAIYEVRGLFMLCEYNLFLDSFKNEEEVYSFINDLEILINHELEFLYLNDEYIKRCFTLFGKFRFKGNTQYDKYINEIIGKLNRINSIPLEEKEKLRNDYLDKFSREHEMGVYDSEILYNLVASDLCVLYNFLYGDNEKEIDNLYTYSSLIAMINKIPELAQDEEIREELLDITNSISKEKGILGRGLQKSLNKSFLKKLNTRN